MLEWSRPRRRLPLRVEAHRERMLVIDLVLRGHGVHHLRAVGKDRPRTVRQGRVDAGAPAGCQAHDGTIGREEVARDADRVAGKAQNAAEAAEAAGRTRTGNIQACRECSRNHGSLLSMYRAVQVEIGWLSRVKSRLRIIY